MSGIPKHCFQCVLNPLQFRVPNPGLNVASCPKPPLSAGGCDTVVVLDGMLAGARRNWHKIHDKCGICSISHFCCVTSVVEADR